MSYHFKRVDRVSVGPGPPAAVDMRLRVASAASTVTAVCLALATIGCATHGAGGRWDDISLGRPIVHPMRVQTRPRTIEDGFMFLFPVRTKGYTGTTLRIVLHENATLGTPYVLVSKAFRPTADDVWTTVGVFVPMSTVPWGMYDLGVYVIGDDEREWLLRLPVTWEQDKARIPDYLWDMDTVVYEAGDKAYLIPTQLYFERPRRRFFQVVTLIHDEQFREVGRIRGGHFADPNARSIKPPAMRVPLDLLETLAPLGQRLYLTPSIEEGTRLFVGNVHFEVLSGDSPEAYRTRILRDLSDRLRRQLDSLR